MGVVYRILNKVNGKMYIGQSINFSRRKYEHTYDLKMNKHTNPCLQEDYNKYGKQNFIYEILEDNISDIDLLYKETYWMNYYGGIESSEIYNEQDIVSHNEEYNSKIRGFIHNEETRKKMSKSHQGHLHTLEEKQKIAEANIGKRKYSKKFIDLLRKEYLDLKSYIKVNELHKELNYTTLRNLIKFGSSQYPNTYYKEDI